MTKSKKSSRPPSPPETADSPPNVQPVEGPVVVGIGASAGGLEAMHQLIEAMPADTGMAFVHIQHLDPQHKSMLAELLQSVTRMRVREAEDNMHVEPNCLYIKPADRDIALVNGALHLVESAEPHRTRQPIDFFFRSLARERGDRAIGVILSGTGTDGTLGIRAIKGAGGTTIAQDPKTAKYDGMPRSAIATQQVDIVAPPQDMPALLREYVKHPYVAAPEVVALTPGAQLEQIFALLRDHTGHDFTQYKRNTIRRRIERRMAVHQQKRLEDYVRQLQRSPAEVDALFKDLLIGVTNFFRDQDAFAFLEEKVIPRLIEATASGGQIRVWVPGCSTGEEAYSIAMLLSEQLDAARVVRKVCVFATDIDPAAIDVARTAVYPEAIAGDVSQERLDRHFTKENGAYRISKRVRETVVFAVQDVLKDPPFSRIDLVSCRNLLIYLEPELQRKLMQLFHAVLNPEGYLFLGASETVGDAADLFTHLDKKWKIYEKRLVPTHPLVGVTSLHRLNDGSGLSRRVEVQSEHHPQPPGIAELTSQMLLDSYAPACVVVDEQYDVVFLQGRTGRYLDLPVGVPRLNVLKMAHGELLRELRLVLQKVAKERGEIVRERVSIAEDGVPRYLRLRVKPFRGVGQQQRLLLVAFEEAPALPPGAVAANPDGQPPDPRVVELERRLASMKESLQSTVEEVETSNEELRSTNEELQSANEELQSTNEELETSREELQSVNEELMTVNAELQKKLEELSHANNDLTNLLNSTEIGTIFLDNALHIKRFTPAIGKLVNLIPSDVGRPVADIVTQVLDDDLLVHAREVLQSLAVRESAVRTKDGRCFLRRILPYRTVDNVIDGVVVTFVNITEVREAQRMVEAMLVYSNTIMNAVRQPIVLLTKQARVVQVNQAFYTTFQVRREDTLGVSIYDVDRGRWSKPELRSLIDGVLAGGPPLDGHEVNQEIPGLGARVLRLYAQRTLFGTKAVAGEEELTVVTMEDARPGEG